VDRIVELEWMRSLLDPYRPDMTLFSAELRGEPAIGATNGHGMCIIDLRLLVQPEPVPDNEKERAEHKKTLDGLKPFAPSLPIIDAALGAKCVNGQAVAISAVKAWATKPPLSAGELDDCAECFGTGFAEVRDLGPVFDKDGCGPIDGPLFEVCPYCEHGALRPGTIAGVTVNRILLRRFLGPLGGPATMAVPDKGQLVFIGHGWLVVLMGLRDDEPNALVFKAAAEQAAKGEG
jgi:hypothetical protein